jgi:hypothetical protein
VPTILLQKGEAMCMCWRTDEQVQGHCILPTRLARALFRLNAKESTAMIQAASLVIMYGRIRLTVGKKAS